jgi:hypothetical protein
MIKHLIRGTQYAIKQVRMKNRGSCDCPKIENPTIKIKKSLGEVEKLEVLIHEILHACFWDMDEQAIDESAVSISEIIIKLFEIKERK